MNDHLMTRFCFIVSSSTLFLFWMPSKWKRYSDISSPASHIRTFSSSQFYVGLNKTWKVEVEVEAIKPGKLKVEVDE